MTSIISPWAYATQLATQAQDRLTQASNLLRLDGPRPFEPSPDHLVGIPEHNGPDSPDNPWFISPKPIAPPSTPNSGALRLAGGAVTAIDQALGLGAQLSAGVTLAFTRAKEEAVTGVRLLETDPRLPIAPGQPALKFDAAGLWLGLAKNLLSLDQGKPVPPVHPPVVRPPVTIQPVPGPGDPGFPITIQPIMPTEPVGPGEPGSPITIKPIDVPVTTMPVPEGPTPLYPNNPDGPVSADPITIQLPSPDSEIQ